MTDTDMLYMGALEKRLETAEAENTELKARIAELEGKHWSESGSVHMMHVPARNPDEYNATFYIDPKTLGQFTGLTDENGTKIFEGDIIQTYDPDEGYAVVRYDDTETEFYADFVGDNVYYGLGGTFRNDDIEVIGNIYDNPELIGEDGEQNE